MAPKYSIVIPVYKNETSIELLFGALEKVQTQLDNSVEVVFVNDASPDSSALSILKRSQGSSLEVKLIHHSRNFGSFSAIRTGFHHASGDFVGVVSADLQEPPRLLLSFFNRLENTSYDIVFGSRISRNDPFLSRVFSSTYWFLYKKFINKEIPRNGVDVFACKRNVVNVVNQLDETNTSLVGMLFWIGFKRDFHEYERLERQHGKSAWTFRNKMRYMSNSVFAFTDLPIRIIRTLGVLGSSISVTLAFSLLIASLTGRIEVPGYAPIMLAILFGNSAILIGLGILGSYLWRTYENSQKRPYAISFSHDMKGEQDEFF
jgi:glycosyltransferase involved in cell wall biosynthesis